MKYLRKQLTEKNSLLEEKEWLVKEIHHRVKNNLQIVISLLSTQSKYLDNEEAVAAISESRHRMQAMSLIHQKLYQSENTTSVNMQTYITELSDYLKTSFNNGKEINFLSNVDEILLDISQAIPIGLILNEVITNAIKYAFEGREAGNIQIKMLCIDGSKILLEIKDNGVGLPDDFNIQISDSMGMRLMKGLVKQINGNLFIANDSGVKLVIDFKAENTLKNLTDYSLVNYIKKIYGVSFHKLLIKALLIFLLLINATGAFAQTVKAENILAAYKNSKSDAVKIKLLLQLDSIYLYQMPDVPKILDSALLMAQQARQMSVLLHFQADYNDATFLVANAYAEKKEMHSALAIANQTSGVLKVHILIMLGERYLFRPGELKQNSDSAYSFIIQAEKLSDSLQNQDWLCQSLCLKGKYYFTTGKIEEGRKCFLQIIEGYQKSGNKLKEADWWAELGRYMPHTESSYNEVISHFKNALFIYKTLGKKKKVADALENLSYLHKLHPDNLILAETELQEAIIIMQSLGLAIYTDYSELAAINTLKGNNNVSLFYALAAVKNMDSLHEEEYSGGMVYSQLGMSYKAVGDVDNSLFYFQKALKYLVAYRIEYLFPICGEITQALLKKNKPKEALDFLQKFVWENPPSRYIDKEIVEASLGDCYFALQNLKAAETSYKQMIVLDSLAQLQMKQQVVGERSNTITGSEAYYSIGKFYVDIKQYALAKSYLLKALSFKRLAASPTRQMDIHQLLFKTDSAQNNYVSAIQHLQTQQRLRDSLFTDRKSKQIAELQIQYEMQKKEKDLAACTFSGAGKR